MFVANRASSLVLNTTKHSVLTLPCYSKNNTNSGYNLNKIQAQQSIIILYSHFSTQKGLINGIKQKWFVISVENVAMPGVYFDLLLLWWLAWFLCRLSSDCWRSSLNRLRSSMSTNPWGEQCSLPPSSADRFLLCTREDFLGWNIYDQFRRYL